ncbi:Cob(I)yrinic acid a,c-diamide adenosyltransferase, mitochondrial [Tetrabaena socialis]|uniref:Cob(I)yrinic acid a,c-diamide adenosyltransferase, mitochondrial n=1 Tax=Tetrabaena socialis TaxID=47790 RepID=A0A2J8A7U4_9CHLO|nr:Cob(I)yrinic acid a,c-diamide adenosyltransferase, mitochondrial [Tetrabaena socialis]|eukprot:PNH08606.1 Cob(I)yrinic acid a,c-diamide adenosyltransferase, mitochondrial [Tetrabaena socialis]
MSRLQTSPIQTIQSRLIDVGSAVATPLPSSSEAKLQRTHFAGAQHTQQLEEWIDAMDTRLTPLRNFILPAGGCTAAALHHARSVRKGDGGKGV